MKSTASKAKRHSSISVFVFARELLVKIREEFCRIVYLIPPFHKYHFG